MKMKKWLLVFATLSIAGILVLVYSYFAVEHYSSPLVFDDIEKLPATKVAVLLGTSSNLVNGGKNQYFENRMNAAAELYKSGKVEYLLVSGDNRQRNYNEPVAMQAALIKRSVPQDKIVLDYAGFRTLDSMVRAKRVFGQSKFIVVSQKFHNERAVYIAHHRGIDAVGFNAADVEIAAGFKTQLREVLARFKMMLDLYLLKTEPHFLGDKIVIGE
ncbi:SanA/YdcF family protein [Owenweeksia hongkongensis]|uniref:SanA/YdcF family protein n=1 Tax=Owenweeksia hongkongensis TaxID=253245 RepID=UPI003A8EC6F0